MSIVGLARPEIRSLHAYDAAAQAENTVRLNANESPHISPIGNFRRPLNRYPEVRPQRLQRTLAERFGCEVDQLMVTRGSSEAIDLLIRTFCSEGRDSVVTAVPSFSMYRHYAEIQGVKVIGVETLANRNFTFDVDALLAASEENSRIIFVCSPNNPTGTPLPREALVRLLNERNNRSAIVIDEAYIEFSEERSAIELLNEYPSLLVLRTLSKALGFAGARCGAVAGPADVIRMLNAVQAPYALATPVVECVENALQQDSLVLAEKAIEEIVIERQRVMAALTEYGFVEKVWPSEANFFLVRVRDVAVVLNRCSERRILLRDVSSELTNCIRITVGSPTDNDLLLSAFDSLEESN